MGGNFDPDAPEVLLAFLGMQVVALAVAMGLNAWIARRNVKMTATEEGASVSSIYWIVMIFFISAPIVFMLAAIVPDLLTNKEHLLTWWPSLTAGLLAVGLEVLVMRALYVRDMRRARAIEESGTSR